jgi:AraC-like DNA-binding protein
MKQPLMPLSHKLPEWKDTFPSAFKGVHLPGSSVLSAVGNFGSLCIQEYKTDSFFIRLNVFDLLHHFVVKTFSENTGIFTRLVLKGRISNETDHETMRILYQNQFSLFKAANPTTIEVYEKNLHISFDAFYSMNFAKDLLQLFPSHGQTNQQLSPYRWADAEALDLIHSILRSKYEKEIRRHYFESRVNDLLFKYLVISAKRPFTEKEATENEMRAIYLVENIITSDISVHYSIPELSKKVLLNEFRLKFLFKKIFGTGPYEYLIRKRLQKARELLEGGLSIKEVAAQVGYRPSDFTTAFRNHFGFPPSIIKKGKS